MDKKRSFYRSLLFTMSIWFLFAAFILMPINTLSCVEQYESVIKDCDGELTVWRAPEDDGLQWDGLCKSVTFDDEVVGDLSDIRAKDLHVRLHGRYLVKFPRNPDLIREFYRQHGKQDDFMRGRIPTVVREAVLSAWADPAWRQAGEETTQRVMKNAWEYGYENRSPTSAMWTSPTNKRAFEDAIQLRLDALQDELGVIVTVDISYVTAR